jgi:hypothetical protein
MIVGGQPSSHTSAQAERHQIQIWRRMTPAQRLELVGDLRKTMLDLTLAAFPGGTFSS